MTDFGTQPSGETGTVVSWRKIAAELLLNLDLAIELPLDLAELAPSGKDHVEGLAYAEALRELGREMLQGGGN